MPIPIITSIISALSIIVGSLLGALFSYLISRNMHKKELEDEQLLTIENRKYEERFKAKEVCDNANIIRLDISTALYQSIRSLQNSDEEKKYLYLLPINKNYSLAIASLSHKYTLKELSNLYQLYGIIEKVNRDIYNWNIGDNRSYENVQVGLKSILYKLYGDNYKRLINIDINIVPYEELYLTEFMEDEYKSILEKLDKLCVIDNLLTIEEDSNS